MRVSRCAVTACLLLLVVSGTGRCQSSAAADVEARKVSTAALRGHVAHLASPQLQGRRGEAARLTAEYIANAFTALGLVPAFHEQTSYTQSFDVSDVIPGARAEPATGCNVGAIVPGSDPRLADEYLVIGAHYDHLGIQKGRLYPGADDNASGVAMLLETARLLATASPRPRRSVLLVGFDLEEEGLIGSRYFVAHPPVPIDQLKLSLTADMIGRSAGGVAPSFVFVVGSEHAPGLRPELSACQRGDSLDIGYLGADLIGPRSDFAPFWLRKIPFLFFSTGEHPDYHRPSDTPEKLDYAKLTEITGLIARLTLRLCQEEELPAWQNEPQIDLEEVDTAHRVLKKLLASDTLPQGSAQRMLASNAQQTMALLLARGRITAAERAWLVGVCKLLLGAF